jgi:hypothetical protein
MNTYFSLQESKMHSYEKAEILIPDVSHVDYRDTNHFQIILIEEI